MTGRGDRLSSYQRSFELGDRLGFVPYINAQMLERALMVALDLQ